MLTPDQIDDFVTLTTRNFKKHKWTDIALQYQQYVSARIMRDRLVTEIGGDRISYMVKVRNTGTARPSGLYDVDITGTDDLAVEGLVPWTMQTANFSYDVNEEFFQADEVTIVKMLKMRDNAMRGDMAELCEEQLWGAPTSSTHKVPMGIPFWFTKDATTTPDGGFNGGNPSGFTGGRAGISTLTYPRWSNWTFGYDSVTVTDCVRKMVKAMSYTNFTPPVPHPELHFGKADREIFATYNTVEALRVLAENRNENHGNQVASYLDGVVVGRVPVRHCFYLTENDPSEPIYGINWNDFRPFAKRGQFMKRSKPQRAPRQRNVRNVHLDNWMNYAAYNLRTSFVGSRA